MRRVFGTRKEKPPPPTLEEAGGRLTVRGDTLDEKIRKLDEQLMKHKEIIRKTRPGPGQEAAKRRALMVLKQKRMYENQREQLYSQQYNLDQTAFTMDSIKDSVQTVQAMKTAGTEIKRTMKAQELDIGNIEKMQDEMADLMDMHSEIQQVMGQSFGVPDDLDEADLLGELDALEDELATEGAGQHAGGVPAYLQEVDLPEAPRTEAPQAQHAQPIPAGAAHADSFGLPPVPQRT